MQLDAVRHSLVSSVRVIIWAAFSNVKEGFILSIRGMQIPYLEEIYRELLFQDGCYPEFRLTLKDQSKDTLLSFPLCPNFREDIAFL